MFRKLAEKKRQQLLSLQQQQRQMIEVKKEKDEAHEEEEERVTQKRIREEEGEEEPTVTTAVPSRPKHPRIRPNKRFTNVPTEVAAATEMVALYQKDVFQQTTGTVGKEKEEEEQQEEEEEEEGNREMPESSFPKVATSRVNDSVILNLEDISERMDPKVMFQKHIANNRKTMGDIVCRIPKQSLVPAMIRLEDGSETELGTWDRSFTAHAIDRGLELPILEVITPEYVADFLREPDPSKAWERACCSPFAKCESVDMGGPLLREFLLPSQTKALLASPFFSSLGTSATVVLPQMRRSCFLCAQRLVFMLWAKQKSASKDIPGSVDNRLVHEYIMAVNCPGGYDMRHILPGFTEWIGLAGPVIGHNRLHYAHSRFDYNRRGWIQKPEMLFQHGVMR
jgi:hypothetical protein